MNEENDKFSDRDGSNIGRLEKDQGLKERAVRSLPWAHLPLNFVTQAPKTFTFFTTEYLIFIIFLLAFLNLLKNISRKLEIDLSIS